MKKAALIALSLLSLTTPFTLAATSDKEIGMENIDVSEVTEEQSISSSSEEELETRVRVTQKTTPTKTKSKPAWKRWVGYGFIIFTGLGCDFANTVGSQRQETNLHAFASNATLPENPECEYELSMECIGVDNRDECEEYLAMESDQFVIIEECEGESQTDYKQLGLGVGSMASRLIQVCTALSIMDYLRTK